MLWVTNTVDRAVADAKSLKDSGALVEPYHSRYRYGDRLERHKAVMTLASRGAHRGGGVAVTTQVCEVSLDISVDLLVTEVAPPASLIQRLGRLNRWATPEDPQPPRPALVVEPENVSPRYYPYEPSDLALGREWLKAVGDRVTSQTDLANVCQTLSGSRQQLTRERSAWLDEGVTFARQPVREDGVTANFVRTEDADRCLDGRGYPSAKEVQRNMIPMVVGPVMKEISGWKTLGPAILAPAGRIDYRPLWGATWRA